MRLPCGKRGTFEIETNAIKGRGLELAVLDALQSYGYARRVAVQVIEVYR